MTGLHPPAQGNGHNTESYRSITPNTTTATAVVSAMPALATTTTAAATSTSTSSGAVALEIGGYKVHPSALAPNTMTGFSSSAFATMTAEQLAATLAANDSLRNSHSENNNNNNGNINDRSGRRSSSADSGFFSNLVVRLLPVVLGSLVGYIVYVYNVRLCIDYILRILNRPVQAGIYLGVFNVFPPKRYPTPPVPPTTTPYQTQHTAKGDTSNSIRSNISHQPVNDTTPLLQSAQSGDQSSLFSRYQAMKQPTSINNVDAEQKSSSALTRSSDFGGSSSTGRGHYHAQDIESAPEASVATLSISKKDGSPRWCDLCQVVKPDRCHHCKECDQCVLRMDHHCPWVNSCIGYNNLKFFYLFIMYASFLAIWVICTTIPIIITAYYRCEQNNLLAWIQPNSPPQSPDCSLDVQWAAIVFLSFFLSVFIMPLTVAHTIYILNNRTTIESLQDARSTFIRVQYRTVNPSSMYAPGVAPPRFNVVLVQPGESMWDRGSWNANWKSIMGPSWWLWFLPYANTPGDGLHEVYNERLFERLVAAPQTGYGQPAVRPLGSRGGFGSRAADAVSSQSTLIPGSTYTIHPTATMSLAVPSSSSGWAKPRTSEDSESSIGSLGRSLPTPHSSPRMAPRE
ncbi:palmitoyltransferase for Vac8p [Mortierella sp. AD032]|nr:palmitoyltransferase for Vac8p [Mortierella sp. AD032]